MLMLLSVLLLMATACRKEPVVKPVPSVNRTMDADSSGVEDPTKPPPHGNINGRSKPVLKGSLLLMDADSVDSGVEDPTKPPPHGN